MSSASSCSFLVRAEPRESWDGDALLAEFNSSNQRVAEYLYSGIDQPYAAVEGATSTSSIQYHEQDELGNVEGTHTGTSVTQSVSYDAWGVPTYSGDLSSRLMWKGLLWEGGPAQGDVVGLSYVRGRWYDPQAGRFIQEDPIGVDGGVNVYLYAGDDPVNGRDPSGMDPGDVCQMLYSVSNGSATWYEWEDTHDTGCLDGGGSGSDSGFDPFAGDPAWGHDEPGAPGGDNPSQHGSTSVPAARPTPQQVFAEVGRRLQPFQHAVGCGGASLIAAGTAVLDANGISEIYDLLIGERMAVSMMNAASIGTARGSIVAVSISTSIVRVPADATAVAHWAAGDARDAAVAMGFDKARRENTQWWGYLPGGASYAAALSAGEACK